MIIFDGVYKYYNTKPVLENINFSISKSEVTTLVGQNGAGKTTIAKLILGILRPDSGKIIKDKYIKFSYLPQKIDLNKFLPIKVSNVIALYKLDLFDNDLWSMLNNFAHIDLLQTKQLIDLSGGELQKIFIASTILSRPDLIILDEPTKNLDYDSELEFYNIINILKAKYKISFFIISHDLHMVSSSSNKVICLNNHICCSGNASDFKKIDGKFSFYHHNHEHNHNH